MSMKTYEYLCQSVGEMEAIRAYLEKRGWRETYPEASIAAYFGRWPIIVFYPTSKMTSGNSNIHLGYFDPITLHEIFAGKLEEPRSVKVQLDSAYTADVFEGYVMLNGCGLSLPWSAIEAMVKAHKGLVGGAK